MIFGKAITSQPKITRTWNKQFQFWKYSCGCIQYKGKFTLCMKHKEAGYHSVVDFKTRDNK